MRPEHCSRQTSLRNATEAKNPMPQAIQLTEEQQRVILAPPGHYLITAVAGSGKTTTLAHRIRYLLEQGCAPQRLLVLMFNKAAQVDFTRKLEQVLPQHLPRPEVRTFHAMGYRLYQRFVAEGKLPAFKQRIISERELQIQLWRLARQIAPKEQQGELKRNKKEHMELALSFVEAVKSQLKAPELVFESAELDTKFRYFLPLFDAIEEWRHSVHRITYADMLYDPVRAIEADPDLLALVSNKMDIVLVDEYQDTNDIQHKLLSQIAGQRAKVTVVGDPDQTIYEFRGAKPSYMLKDFQKEFPETQTLFLSYSFRYGHLVSLLANHLIAQNRGRASLLCHSHTSTPDTMVELISSSNEAQSAVSLLQGKTAEDLAEHTVLLRVWSQSIPFELAFLQAKIPYHTADQRSVFNSDELQAIQSLLELSAGYFPLLTPEQRHQRLVLLMRFPHLGINDSEIQQLAQALSTYEQKWGRMLEALIPADLKKFQAQKIQQLAQALSLLESKELSVSKTLRYYTEQCALFEGIRSLSLNQDYAEEQIASIKAIMRYLESMAKDCASVLEELNHLRSMAAEPHTDGVLISTIHRAKGLEWPHVFIAGFNDRHFPYRLRNRNLLESDMESERRLLYVAMTRAKQSLKLFTPMRENQHERSRFEYELQWPACEMANRALATQATSIDASDLQSQICQRYAEQLGVDIEGHRKLETVPAQDEPIWFAERVQHRILGVGKVTRESDTSFSVEFAEDEKVREFSKDSAEQFFSVVS